MAVTYAWKIDSQLYAYIVNPNCLDDNGQLKSVDDYMDNTPADENYTELNEDLTKASDDMEKAQIYQQIYMGYVTPTPLSDIDDKKVQMYCTSKFYIANKYTESNYKNHFESMVKKGKAYAGYSWIDFQDYSTYFNVDSNCGKLTGAQGQPAIITSVSSVTEVIEEASASTLEVTIQSTDRVYHEYSEQELIDSFSDEFIKDDKWETDESYFDLDGKPKGANDLNSPDYLKSGNTYFIKVDTGDTKNEYEMEFKLSIPVIESFYKPESIYIKDETNKKDKDAVVPVTIGGISGGTPITEISGKCFSELANMILFPEVFPMDKRLTAPSYDALVDERASDDIPMPKGVLVSTQDFKNDAANIWMLIDPDNIETNDAWVPVGFNEEGIRDIAQDVIDKWISGTSEAFDTLQEIDKWISGHSGETLTIIKNIADTEQTIAEFSGAVKDIVTKFSGDVVTTIDRLSGDVQNTITGLSGNVATTIVSLSGSVKDTIVKLSSDTATAIGSAVQSANTYTDSKIEELSASTTISALEERIEKLESVYNQLAIITGKTGGLVIINPDDDWTITIENGDNSGEEHPLPPDGPDEDDDPVDPNPPTLDFTTTGDTYIKFNPDHFSGNVTYTFNNQGASTGITADTITISVDQDRAVTVNVDGYQSPRFTASGETIKTVYLNTLNPEHTITPLSMGETFVPTEELETPTMTETDNTEHIGEGTDNAEFIPGNGQIGTNPEMPNVDLVFSAETAKVNCTITVYVEKQEKTINIEISGGTQCNISGTPLSSPSVIKTGHTSTDGKCAITFDQPMKLKMHTTDPPVYTAEYTIDYNTANNISIELKTDFKPGNRY